jgi:predicted ATPase
MERTLLAGLSYDGLQREMMRGGSGVKKIVLTGGPGAGKTAILELAKRQFSGQFAIIPESASVVFGGGFWRHNTLPGRRAAQRAIYHVQREFETMLEEEGLAQVALCDRGTVDGAAYWPDGFDGFFQELGTTRAAEYARYTAVIHLRTPASEQGYNAQNPLRTESAVEAQAIDQRIHELWSGHPRVTIINSADDFLVKANRALAAIQRELMGLPSGK